MLRALALSALALTPGLARASTDSVLVTQLAALAPGLDSQVLDLAVRSVRCATGQSPESAANKLVVIDYSKPSTERRMWVFDLTHPALLLNEQVAHGAASGENYTTAFSNRPGSHQSSLGLFRTSSTYVGKNGYSLRLDGLEPGINDRARERAIVIHGAPYVSDAMIRQQGRLGRSHGCPAVRESIAVPLIDSIKDGQYVFAYYPDQAWLRRSQLLACSADP